jgi:hypothetical protein
MKIKIIVLHGDDTEKSYARLTVFINEAKKRSWKITDFSIEELENQNLFGEENFYILKDYKKIDKKIVGKIKKYEGNLIIYNQGFIPAPALKMINPDKIEKFELPQLLWNFLDNMTTEKFHELLKTQAVEYLLAMMSWKFKQNYLKNPNDKNADLIMKLADIDVDSKTGRADLVLSIDLLLSKQLQ